MSPVHRNKRQKRWELKSLILGVKSMVNTLKPSNKLELSPRKCDSLVHLIINKSWYTKVNFRPNHVNFIQLEIYLLCFTVPPNTHKGDDSARSPTPLIGRGHCDAILWPFPHFILHTYTTSSLLLSLLHHFIYDQCNTFPKEMMWVLDPMSTSNPMARLGFLLHVQSYQKQYHFKCSKKESCPSPSAINYII